MYSFLLGRDFEKSGEGPHLHGFVFCLSTRMYNRNVYNMCSHSREGIGHRCSRMEWGGSTVFSDPTPRFIITIQLKVSVNDP